VVAPLAGTPAAEGDQGRKVAVAVAVLRQQTSFMPSASGIRCRQQLQSDRLGRHVGAHDAGERAFIGDCQRRVAEFGGLRDQFLRVRGAAQEAEVGEAMQFGVAGQAASSSSSASAV
jgi:hypothetical protein